MAYEHYTEWQLRTMIRWWRDTAYKYKTRAAESSYTYADWHETFPMNRGIRKYFNMCAKNAFIKSDELKDELSLRQERIPQLQQELAQ